MRINYDTYDMRREQDSINPDSHPNIMMLAPEDSGHPFYYARVLAIFHVHAHIWKPGSVQPPWTRMHLCFVQWYEVVHDDIRPRRPTPLRWSTLDEDAFGFVDPESVLRASHIISAETYGRSDEALEGYSAARDPEDVDDCDWNRYIANPCVLCHHAEAH